VPIEDTTRRLFLRLMAGGLGLSLFPFAASSDPAVEVVGSPPSDLSQALLAAFPTAAAIGEQALADGLVERDAEQLLVELGISQAASASSDASVAAIREQLALSCREDFRAGRTRFLRGWLLSLTELRLAALLSLESERS
jgi:predicted metal-dependent HD superfamily phosphohydrolase